MRRVPHIVRVSLTEMGFSGSNVDLETFKYPRGDFAQALYYDLEILKYGV